MDTQEITQRVLFQRLGRYADPGPSLAPAGSARFNLDSRRLRVAYAAAQPGRADEVVSSVLRFARAHRLQVQWSVVPTRSGEEELGSALLAADFSLAENLLLMAHKGYITAQLNPEVSVIPITTWDAMWRYEQGSRRAFYDDPYPSDEFMNQRTGDRWREQEHGWSRYYAAYLNGKQVGGCYVTLFEDCPTLVGVYTLHEARRRGVATAVLQRAIASVVTPQNDICCLFVEHHNPAEALYRQLGFVPICDMRTYIWGFD